MEQVSRMAAEVNKLIGSSLLDGKAVYIPEVGSLYIVVNPEGGKRVDFSSAERGTSLIEIIKDRAGCTPEQGVEIFSRWIEEVRTPKTLLIVGVGELRIKTFVAEEAFMAQLNPDAAPAPAPAAAEPAPAAAPAPAEPELVAPIKKSSNKVLWIALVVILLAVGGYLGYTSYSEAQAEKALIEAAAREKAAEQQRVADSIAMAQMEARRLAEAEAALLAAKTPRYRVVYGVYRLRSNVDVAIENINAQYGDDRGQEYPYGPCTMVTMFESDDRDEAQAFLMEYYDLYPDAWVHDSEQ
ncbi:MAG: hypothetical protein SNI45_06345 [Rikenellaceae bacterium]